MKKPEELAAQLWDARLNGGFCEPLTDAISKAQAYEIQYACTDSAPIKISLLGYKIGATNQETLKILGLDAPFFGPLYDTSFATNDGHKDTLPVALHMQHKPRVEAEFVVSVNNDVQRGSADITVNDLHDSIAWVAPGIEIVASRFSDAPEHPGNRAIADFGANQYMIVGKPFIAWRELDLNAHPVTLNIDNQAEVKGHSGLSLYGNPLEFVCWLLNQPAMHSTGLKAGQMVSCGTCTGAPFLENGNRVTADYGLLGRISLEIHDQKDAKNAT